MKVLFDRLFKWLNDLNPRQLLILASVMMVLMFAVIYIFLSWWTADKEVEVRIEQPPVPEMSSVVTAKVDIAPLTVIKSEMLDTKEVAKNLVPEDAITDTAEIIDNSTKTAIFAGDLITKRKLLTDLNELTFVGSIPADCRAVSISVNEITGVDGFAKPGDKVDLLLAESNGDSGATTSILLQDVLLLSINKNMSKNNESTAGEDGKVTTSAIQNPSTATFALQPDDILKLISASKLGEIYLALRPKNPINRYSDSGEYTIRSANSNKSQQTTPKVTELPPIPSASEKPVQDEAIPDVNRIEIIQGDKIVQKK